MISLNTTVLSATTAVPGQRSARRSVTDKAGFNIERAAYLIRFRVKQQAASGAVQPEVGGNDQMLLSLGRRTAWKRRRSAESCSVMLRSAVGSASRFPQAIEFVPIRWSNRNARILAGWRLIERERDAIRRRQSACV